MDKIKRYLKDKKGSAKSIVVVFMSIVVLLLCTLLIEVIVCESSAGYISQTASFIMRTLSDQGGIKTIAPEDYKGTYITSRELYNTLDSGFKEAGFVEWSLSINGKTFNSRSNITAKRKEYIEIHLEGAAPVISDLLNINSDTLAFSANRKMISNYEERTGDVSILK